MSVSAVGKPRRHLLENHVIAKGKAESELLSREWLGRRGWRAGQGAEQRAEQSHPVSCVGDKGWTLAVQEKKVSHGQKW